MKLDMFRAQQWARVMVRVALAGAFFSAVADRLGLWGEQGAQGVVWGNFARFVVDVQVLNPWAPHAVAWWLAAIVTLLEVVLASQLLVGWRQREAALASGVLLSTFGVAMLVFIGPKAPLDYSVFSAASAALLLACTVPSERVSIR